MKAITLGKVFFHPIKVKVGTDRFHVATTQETDVPYRRGKCVIIRLFGEWSLAVGIWTKKIPDEETALMLAMQAREDQIFEDGKLAERFVRNAALQKIAAHADNIDDEWRIVSALGLLEEICECPEGECDCDEDDGGLAA